MEKDTKNITLLKEKWCEALNDDINDVILLNSFKIAKKFSPSEYQHYNQYKWIHRRTVNNQLLKQMNIVETESCTFCKEYPETIEHIYLHSTNVSNCGTK